MEELVGLIGIFVFFFGVHLIWQARDEVLFWLHKFLGTFRKSLRETSGLNHRHDEPGAAPAAAPERHMLRMVGGFGLAVLGQLLFLLGLVLVFTN
ncbi:MAG TPA: hypothetical protein VGA40_06710 [Candidatus Acidoferrales bacterium]